MTSFANEIRVLYTRPEPLEPEGEAAALALLSSQERGRYERLRIPERRLEFLTAHLLLRRLLSRRAPISPAAWRFEIDDRGKPELASDLGAPPLRFSLSHTSGLVACAVALNRAVGLDVERIDRGVRMDAAAERTFSETELKALSALQGRSRAAAARVALWTLKEAYGKARGVGLSYPLKQVSFALSRPIAVRLGAELEDNARAWQFEQLRPTPEHLLSLAVRIGAGKPPLRIDAREAHLAQILSAK